MREKSNETLQQLEKMGNKCPDRERFIRASEGMDMYHMSRTTFIKIARDSGGLYKINGLVLVDKDVFDKYLETYRIPGEMEGWHRR